MTVFALVKFVHVSAAMVFFGLPFAFGRWWHTACLGEGDAACRYTADRMRFFVRLHMNVCALLLLGTGGWLARGYHPWPLWLWIGLAVTLAAVGNLHGQLGVALRRFATCDADEASCRALRRRIAVFTAVHHTLVTAGTAAMIFRPL